MIVKMKVVILRVKVLSKILKKQFVNYMLFAKSSYRFIFPLVLNQLSIEIPQESADIVHILSNIFIACALAPCLLLFFFFIFKFNKGYLYFVSNLQI